MVVAAQEGGAYSGVCDEASATGIHKGDYGIVMQTNKLHIGDNLPILRDMEDASVDLVYLDPPFGSGKSWHGLRGHVCEGVSFEDSKFSVDEDPPNEVAAFVKAQSDKDKAYLTFITLRLAELRRILKPTGSLYLHCDDYMSHYLKVCLDMLFGRSNFKNDIAWLRRTGVITVPKNLFPKITDSILLYGKSDKAFFSLPRRPRSQEQIDTFSQVDKDGRRYRTHAKEFNKSSTRFNQYLDEAKDIAIGDNWHEDELRMNAVCPDRTGWPTEKPIKLLTRIIEASSTEGDLVLDPFAGSGTTLVAAELLNRRWCGIDINKEATRILNHKLQHHIGALLAPNIPQERHSSPQCDLVEQIGTGIDPNQITPQNATQAL